MNSIIEGNLVSLREMDEGDIDNIIRWRNNPRVRCNFIYREDFTRESQLKWIEDYVRTGKVLQMIICSNELNRPVGCVYFKDIDKDSLQAEYGIFIGDDAAVGKGYGTETAKLAFAIAKERLGIKRVILRVFMSNRYAIKSYMAAGFTVVKNMPGIVCSDGSAQDMVLMKCML